MTTHDFRVLPKQSQIQLTTFSATYLCHRVINGCSVCLYYLDGIFIEVYYINSANVDVMINAFVGNEPLNYYLDNIDLDKLMEL